MSQGMAKKKTKKPAAEVDSPEKLPEAFASLAPEDTIRPLENDPAPADVAGLPKDDPPSYAGELLPELPRPAFQRIMSLRVGQHCIEPTPRGSFAFLRGAASHYASGYVGEREALAPGELQDLAKDCQARAKNVLSLHDFLKELRRRSGGPN
jgi:hypothetical protein